LRDVGEVTFDSESGRWLSSWKAPPEKHEK